MMSLLHNSNGLRAPTRSYINVISLISLTQIFMMMIACDDERLFESEQIHVDHDQPEISGKADGDHAINFGDDTQAPKDCTFDADDLYEPRSRFQKGPSIGECHDTQSKRPVGFVDDDLAEAYQGLEDHYALYNVFHNGDFWIAFVPHHSVKHVYFQLEYFPAVVPAGHAQLRIEYDQPIMLYGQSTHVQGQIDQTHNLALSIEAVTPVGGEYDLFKGARDHFAIAYRVTTMEARFQSMIVDQDHHVEQWRLNLTPDESEAILPHYVSVSSTHLLSFSYHTLFKNCTTEIIEVLDGIGEYSWREQVQRFVVKVTEIYPNIVRAALIARGLLPLDQSTDWYPLEEDEEFIEQMYRDDDELDLKSSAQRAP